MDINYFNLSGGINQSLTKTEMGCSPQKIYWEDSANVEIYNNRGIIKQKGNTLFLTLPVSEAIIAMNEIESDGIFKLVIVTETGKIYIYDNFTNSLVNIPKTLTGAKIEFVNFLNGVLIYSESDPLFYIKNNSNYDIVDCNVQDRQGYVLYPTCVTVYKGRIWCASQSTIYYSALGSYNNFTLENDAGYISDFHTDTSDILGMHTYKDYLAIYKKERVYLLSGSNPNDFSITLFADKGTTAKKSIINIDNKQYFLSNGIFALEQVGELNQIRLGSEISGNIREEFEKFDSSKISKTYALHYQKKNQTWFFFPYLGNDYYNTIWINDYVNKAWYKRVLPQNITSACVYNSRILTADDEGKIYIEDYGTTFANNPIEFYWRSPFLSLGNVHHRKLIDEFYFILDDINDNKFKCSVYKDYDSTNNDDNELINSVHYDALIWGDSSNDLVEVINSWPSENSSAPIWSISSDVIEKAEICGSCYSIQISITGSEIDDNCAIIGLQFREIYNDD